MQARVSLPPAANRSTGLAWPSAAAARSRHAAVVNARRMLRFSLPCASPRRQGFDVAKKALLEFLDGFKTPVDVTDREVRGGRSRGALACGIQGCAKGTRAVARRAGSRNGGSSMRQAAACMLLTLIRPRCVCAARTALLCPAPPCSASPRPAPRPDAALREPHQPGDQAGAAPGGAADRHCDRRGVDGQAAGAAAGPVHGEAAHVVPAACCVSVWFGLVVWICCSCFRCSRCLRLHYADAAAATRSCRLS